MYCAMSVHVGRVRTYYLSGGTVFRVDNLGSGKCIFYRGGGGTKSLGRTYLRGIAVLCVYVCVRALACVRACVCVCPP